MKKSKRKFVFTNALYKMIWVLFVVYIIKIILFTINELDYSDWEAIGLLYEGCIWDYLRAITLLIIALSFKKEDVNDEEKA